MDNKWTINSGFMEEIMRSFDIYCNECGSDDVVFSDYTQRNEEDELQILIKLRCLKCNEKEVVFIVDNRL